MENPESDAAMQRSIDAHHRLLARPDVRMEGAEQVVVVTYPGCTALDLVGPHHFLASWMGADVRVAAMDEEVRTDTGLRLAADVELAAVETADLVVVPGGGPGVAVAARRPGFLEQLHRLARAEPTWASVCTGALLLGAAGLLVGRRATTHWAAHHLLAEFGAIPVTERLVEDGPVLTAAGVTAGIDLGVRLTERFRGSGYAQAVAAQAEVATPPDGDADLLHDIAEMSAPLGGSSWNQPDPRSDHRRAPAPGCTCSQGGAVRSDPIVLALLGVVALSVLAPALALAHARRAGSAALARTGRVPFDVLAVLLLGTTFGLGLPAALWYATRVRPALPARVPAATVPPAPTATERWAISPAACFRAVRALEIARTTPVPSVALEPLGFAAP